MSYEFRPSDFRKTWGQSVRLVPQTAENMSPPRKGGFIGKDGREHLLRRSRPRNGSSGREMKLS